MEKEHYIIQMDKKTKEDFKKGLKKAEKKI